MALISKLTAIGDAIRNKLGTTKTYTLDEMVEAIESISFFEPIINSRISEKINLTENIDIVTGFKPTTVVLFPSDTARPYTLFYNNGVQTYINVIPNVISDGGQGWSITPTDTGFSITEAEIEETDYRKTGNIQYIAGVNGVSGSIELINDTEITIGFKPSMVILFNDVTINATSYILLYNNGIHSYYNFKVGTTADGGQSWSITPTDTGFSITEADAEVKMTGTIKYLAFK